MSYRKDLRVADRPRMITSDVVDLIASISRQPSALDGSVIGKRASPEQRAVVTAVFGASRPYGFIWNTVSVEDGRLYVRVLVRGDGFCPIADHRTRVIVRGPKRSTNSNTERRFLPVLETWEREVDAILLTYVRKSQFPTLAGAISAVRSQSRTEVTVETAHRCRSDCLGSAPTVLLFLL